MDKSFWSLYWITRLDYIQQLAIFILALTSIMMLIDMYHYMLARQKTRQIALSYIDRHFTLRLTYMTVFVIALITLALLPDTKTVLILLMNDISLYDLVK